MNLVQSDNGALELRWTWLPYWLVVSPAMKHDIERTLRDAILLNGAPCDSSLDAMDKLIIRIIVQRWPIPGLDKYLEALHAVKPVDSSAAQ